MIGASTIFVTKLNGQVDMYRASGYLSVSLSMSRELKSSYDQVLEVVQATKPTLTDVPQAKIDSVAKATQCVTENRPNFDEHAGDHVFMLNLQTKELSHVWHERVNAEGGGSAFANRGWHLYESDADKRLKTMDSATIRSIRSAMESVSHTLPIFRTTTAIHSVPAGTLVAYVPWSKFNFYQLNSDKTGLTDDSVYADPTQLAFVENRTFLYKDLMAADASEADDQ